MADNSNPELNQTPINDSVDDYGQYHVDKHFEMCSILKSLIVKPDVITAYYDATMNNFILTSVISVDVIKRNFILDCGSDEKRNSLVVNNDRLTCKTKCNNVRVEFSIREIKLIKVNGEEAFLCDLPKNILYLQRRDFYRMAIPLGDKLVCKINSGNNTRRSLTLADISSGGIGLNDTNLSTSHELFERANHCEIDLGEIGNIAFDIELRSKKVIKINNKEVLRLGYKFIDLQTPDNAKIQRYIHSIDMRKKQSK